MSKCKIKDLITLQRGFDITKKEQEDGFYPVVSSSGINSFHSKFMVKGPGVVIGRKGSLGTAFYIESDFWPHDTTLWVKDFKGNNPYYIYCLLKWLHLENLDSGSANPTLNRNYVHEISIPSVDIEQQKSIEEIGSTIDHRIHNNSHIYSELESMAKTLYDYWFVQFDFPNKNGKPYRTSGGEMVWNEQLKREIPKGWNVATINDMTHSYRGVSYDKKDLLPTAENGILVLRGNNIQNNRLVYDTNVAYVPSSLVSKEQQIRAHDIILTMSSGSKEHIGKCTMFQYDSPHTYGAFLTKFTPDSDKVGFVYLSMISDFFKKKIQSICNGTGINNLTNETFDNLVFPKPDRTILGYFEEIVAPLLKKMGDCDRENEELRKLRDWLLPMLMNGQARVE